MLDENNLVRQPTNDWQDHLNWGDVLAFRFPIANDRVERPLKVRACAVLDICNIVGKRFVTLTVGLDAGAKPQGDYETCITRPAALHVAGLTCPTLFDCRQSITVSICNKGFDLRTGGTPIIGLLTGPERVRFNAVRARIHAENDMAAYHRAEQRSKHIGREPARKWPTLRKVVIAPRPLRGRVRPIELV